MHFLFKLSSSGRQDLVVFSLHQSFPAPHLSEDQPQGEDCGERDGSPQSQAWPPVSGVQQVLSCRQPLTSTTDSSSLAADHTSSSSSGKCQLFHYLNHRLEVWL